jgi:uncharacterized protein
MPHANPSDEELRALLASSRTIAIVGASSKLDRPSHGVMKILIDAGYTVIPVTPRESSVLGRQAYPSLADVPAQVDIVDVFRRAEETPPIADDAAKIGAKALWLQLGISNDDAAERASAAGLVVVMDRCIGRTVKQLDVHPAGWERARDIRAADEVVGEADKESFPASDPPAWTPLHTGTPYRDE